MLSRYPLLSLFLPSGKIVENITFSRGHLGKIRFKTGHSNFWNHQFGPAASSGSPNFNVPSSFCKRLNISECLKWVFLPSSVLLSGLIAFLYPKLSRISISCDVTLEFEVLMPTLRALFLFLTRCL